MNEKRAGGPSLLPFVVVPVAMLLTAKAIHRHQRRHWAGIWGVEGGRTGRRGRGGYGGPGHHGRHGWGGPFESDAEGGRVHLPPQIEAILDAWHSQAHADDSGDSGETTTA
jgi:hypothetical protein